jgi:hypothetical protein
MDLLFEKIKMWCKKCSQLLLYNGVAKMSTSHHLPIKSATPGGASHLQEV